MGRNASIQMFLLTLTGCSWMLLFLSITLPDYHVFRVYRAASAAAAHTPPPRELDPCEVCWGVGKACLEAEADVPSRQDDYPSVAGGTGWGARLAWVVGLGSKKKDKASPVGAAEAGGVGAFYYYTLHTTFTALRIRLKKAQQVAGDVHEEVATLGERVATLHHTLTTHFSPYHNPYLQQTRLTQPTHNRSHVNRKNEANPTPPNYHKTKDLVDGKEQEGSSSRRQNQGPTLDAHQENLRRVYPVKVVKPSKDDKKEYLVAANRDQVRAKNTNLDLGSSHHKKIQSVYPDLPGPRERNSQSEKQISKKLEQVTNYDRISENLNRKKIRTFFSSSFRHQLSVNRTSDPLKHKSDLHSGKSNELSRPHPEGPVEAVTRGLSVLGMGNTGDIKARDASGWYLNRGPGDVRRTVSVVVVGREQSVGGLVASVGRVYPGITVHLVTSTPPSQRSHHQVRLIVHKVEANTTNSVAYTEVLGHVTTPYVLVAAGMTSLTPLARVDRLLVAAEHLGVWAVSGGLETPSGRWRTGCLTSSYAHYQASWSRGRLATAGECLLCQGLEGPFLALTTALRHIGWDTKLPNEVIQLDLFLRAAHSHHMMAASCPQSLFSVSSEPEPPSRVALLSFARRHSVYSIQAAGGVLVTFSCSEVGAGCGDTKLALPPCCRQELASLVRFMMDTCEAHGLLCELQEGTLLGAVKLEGVMPWERDADITFHTKNFTALGELKDVFDRAGYSLYLTDNRWCCVDGRWAGGQGTLSSGQWRAELWSQHAMDSEDNLLAGRPRTRIEFDGSWVPVPTSPAQYVRNRYGVEVFRHAQHWLDTGRSSGWEEYEAGKFLPCSRPAHHACLDQFMPDGNLKLHPLCVT